MDFDPLWIRAADDIGALQSLRDLYTYTNSKRLPKTITFSKLLVFLFDSPSFSSPIGRKGSEKILNFREKRERKKSGNELDLFNTPRKKLFFFSFNTKRVLVRGTTSGAIITLVNELALRNQPINTLPSNEKTSTGSLIIQSSLFPFSFTSIGRDHLR